MRLVLRRGCAFLLFTLVACARPAVREGAAPASGAVAPNIAPPIVAAAGPAIAPPPVEAPSPPAWAEVATGVDHTCARTTAGAVYCWGSNARAQLGDGTKIDRRLPTRVLLDHEAVEIRLSNYASCARLADGTVACWGSDTGWDGKEAGKLDEVPTPTRAMEISDAARLFVGDVVEACVAKTDATVWCWGTGPEPERHTSLAPHEAPSLRGALAISFGLSFACALWESPGELRCWGYDSTYEVFGVRGNKPRPTPTPIPKLPKIRSFTADFARTCAVAEDAGVLCWGDRLKLHNGPALEWLEPTRVAGLSEIVAVDHSLYQLCALRRDGQVLCLGRNDKGQLGDGSTAQSLKPRAVLGVEGAIGLAVGEDHGCAVARDGRLWCWGSNAKGQLGDGTNEDRPTPIVVGLPAK